MKLKELLKSYFTLNLPKSTKEPRSICKYQKDYRIF